MHQGLLAAIQQSRQRALDIDWIAIGSGAAGYYDTADTGSWGGAPGAAGGQVHGSDIWLPGTTRTVVIAAGASKADKTVRNGNATTLQGYTPAKGGRGGTGKNTGGPAAGDADPTQGYSGGARVGSGNTSGGAGGAGKKGGDSTSDNGGPGGDGYLWLDGQYYGPGAGAGSRAGSPAPAGLGTSGNDGEGGRWDNGGNNGTANKGGGGGGGGSASGYGRSDSGSGGSGVVCIRQRGTELSLSYTGTYTTNVVGEFRFYYLKSSGTLTVASNV